jgi:dihydroneopterin aldolase
MAFTFVVKLEAMRFHAIEVDVSAWVSREKSAHGSEGVLDYRRVYDLVSTIVTKGHIQYLEDLTAEVADQTLALDGVQRVLVNARKPQVALSGPLAYAQVTLERVRDD